jgi:hypothetical protein
MRKVLDDAIKMVNFIKQRLIDSKLFKKYIKTWTKSTKISCYIQISGGNVERSSQ